MFVVLHTQGDNISDLEAVKGKNAPQSTKKEHGVRGRQSAQCGQASGEATICSCEK